MGHTPGNGLFGIKVHSDDVPLGCTGIRYWQKVVRCDPEGPEGARRILFSPKHLGDTSGNAPHGLRAVEAAVFSFWVRYADGDGTLPWPPANQPGYTDQAGLWLRIGNLTDVWPDGPVGERPVNKTTKKHVSRANFGFDGRSDTMIEGMVQQSMVGVITLIELRRRRDLIVRVSQPDWGGRFVKKPDGTYGTSSTLPPGSYSIWRLSIGDLWKMDFALPRDESIALRPWEASSWFSEFWNYDDRRIEVEMWGCQIRLPSGKWQDCKRFQYHIHWPENEGYGPLVQQNGRLLMSNDPALTYAPKGSVLVLP